VYLAPVNRLTLERLAHQLRGCPSRRSHLVPFGVGRHGSDTLLARRDNGRGACSQRFIDFPFWQSPRKAWDPSSRGFRLRRNTGSSRGCGEAPPGERPEWSGSPLFGASNTLATSPEITRIMVGHCQVQGFERNPPIFHQPHRNSEAWAISTSWDNAPSTSGSTKGRQNSFLRPFFRTASRLCFTRGFSMSFRPAPKKREPAAHSSFHLRE